MKKFICAAICMICAVLLIGILGGIECGEPISNAWMCVPLLGIIAVAGGIYTLSE